MTVFKDKADLYNMYKIKLHKTSKCLWPVYIEICLLWNVFFFEVFINHVPRILRSVLGKITTDQFYFWDAYDVSLWESYLSEKVCYIETRL